MMDNLVIQDNSNKQLSLVLVWWWCGVVWRSRALASFVELKEEMDQHQYKEILQRYLLYIVMAYGLDSSHLIFQHNNDPKNTKKKMYANGWNHKSSLFLSDMHNLLI